MNSKNPGIFIALLFLVALLFIVGINLAAAHSDDQKFQIPSWITGLSTTVARPQPLQLADLSPTPMNCIQHGRLAVPVGETCTFAIHQSLFALRTITLQLVQGTAATLSLTQEKVLPIQENLTQGNAMTTADQMKVYPGKHGMLVIECTDAGSGGALTCLLDLK